MSGAWSRRRAAVKAEAEADAHEAKQAALTLQQEKLAEKSEDEVLAELDLPQPDDMQAGDDFTVFMKETVPSALRNRALRKLWLTDPVLANVDGLVDYGDNFAAEGKLGEMVKTIYRVGKGMLTDEDLAESEAVEDLVEDTPEELDATVDEAVGEGDDEEPVETALFEEPEHPTDEIYETAPLKRKMRFEFQEIGNE